MKTTRRTLIPFFGILSLSGGIFLYSVAFSLGLLRATFLDTWIDKIYIEKILWYSPIPIMLGVVLFLIGLMDVIKLRRNRELTYIPIDPKAVTVGLTAYNDEESISGAVEDFLSHDLVDKVIVISNNSTDRTIELAEKAGAIVFNEPLQGYGACVKRAMVETARIDDSGVVVICEGDLTFRSYDLDKLIPYLAHADVANGTRIVESLQDRDTQLSVFMHYGNLFVGKLLESKYLGEVSLTDVGTTYKVIRTEFLVRLLPKLDVNVNLTFNPFFMEKVITTGGKLVEVPITFHPRVGESKGGNVSNLIAFKLGLKMIVGIIFGWKYAK